MRFQKINIGGLETPNNIFLAPLAGYTNAVFRQMCFDLGAGLTVTEMVSAKGLCYDNEKTRDLLSFTPEYGGIKACQLFGGDPDFMYRAVTDEVLSNIELIDINMGCPMPKIYNNGEGSALMNDFKRAEGVISACKKSGKRVSVKFRIGLTDNDIKGVEFAKMCEGAGADMICVHGRTRDKIYAGDVNFAEIERCKNAVKIPVIANGGVFSKEDAELLLDRTGADGIAIARGAMYSPWLFAEILGKGNIDKKQIIKWQINRTFEMFDSRFAVVYMRKMIAFYIRGIVGSSSFKVRLFSANDRAEIENILEEINF
jgi:nifR3 family TIM-barrel protein